MGLYQNDKPHAVYVGGKLIPANESRDVDDSWIPAAADPPAPDPAEGDLVKDDPPPPNPLTDQQSPPPPPNPLTDQQPPQPNPNPETPPSGKGKK